MKQIPGQAQIAEAARHAFENHGDNPAPITDGVVEAVAGQMREFGYPETLDPLTVIIAAMPARWSKRLAVEDGVRSINSGFAADMRQINIEHAKRMLEEFSDHLPPASRNKYESMLQTPEVVLRLQSSYALGNRQEQLSGFGRRVVALGVAGGVGLGVFGLADIAHVKAALGHEVTAAPFGYELALKRDPSILPGNTGKGTIMSWATHIPGIPDFSDFSALEMKSVTTQVPTKLTVGATASSLARNPVAADLKLTGKEYALDKEAAAKLVKQIITEKITPKSIEVTGVASDLFAGKVGARDPEQVPLEKLRANEMVRALKAEAKKANISLPKIDLAYQEDVFTKKEISELDTLAAKMNISRSELLTRYQQSALPAELLIEIDSFSRPGAEIVLEGRKTETKLVDQEKIETGVGIFPDTVPGEAIVGFGGLMGAGIAAGYGGLALIAMSSRVARKRANQIVRREFRKPR